MPWGRWRAVRCWAGLPWPPARDRPWRWWPSFCRRPCSSTCARSGCTGETWSRHRSNPTRKSATPDGRPRPAPTRPSPRSAAGVDDEGGASRVQSDPTHRSGRCPCRAARRRPVVRVPPAPRGTRPRPGAAAVHRQDPARERAAPRRIRRWRGDRRGRPHAGQLGSGATNRCRAALHARARPPPGLHRRARRGGSGRHARRRGRRGRGPGAYQPAHPGRPGDRSLGPGGSLRLRPCLRRQRGPRVRAQRGALRPPALGPAGLRQLPRGAPGALFPVDDETLRYLRMTGRPAETVARVDAYAREQGLFRTDDSVEPRFSESLSLDLGSVEPSVAGPRRPQDRVPLADLRRSFRAAFRDGLHPHGVVDEASGDSFPASDPTSFSTDPALVHSPTEPSHEHDQRPTDMEYTACVVVKDGTPFELRPGSVVIAAITSCTNTSNPSVMVAAGLLARNAVDRGLRTPPWVKTSLAPGSRAVTDYLGAAGLMEPLEALGFDLVGYGCTTCIGNSGPLADEIAAAITDNDLVGVAGLSGNRNFEGRIHPLARASYLASPPLVVAFALAGRVDIDLTTEPLGTGRDGEPVMLADLWPTPQEVASVVLKAVSGDVFTRNYASVFDGDDRWRSMPVPAGERYAWDKDSTYVALPPFFSDPEADAAPPHDIGGARVLAMLGDSVTTDHISPAGSIARTSPAGAWLVERGVEPRDFNSYGARRGHHEVMMRGTFANIRLRNLLAPDAEGNVTEHLPSGERMSIYEAAMRYAEEGTPLIILAGKEYGSGSSRDWAAKGPMLQGVRAVVAESYERIHRSNLVGMGILPLQFKAGENAASVGLSGRETFDIVGLSDGLKPRQELAVIARGEEGRE